MPITIALNTRQIDRLAATEKKVAELRPHWEGVIAAHGAVIGSLLDAADIDPATVTDVKVVGQDLLVTLADVVA